MTTELWPVVLAMLFPLLTLIAMLCMRSMEREHRPSLRDQFAAQAMQGICAHNDTWGLVDIEIAQHAYKLADLMLAERGRK